MTDNKTNLHIPAYRVVLDLSINAVVKHIPTEKLYRIERQIDYGYVEGVAVIGDDTKILPIVELTVADVDKNAPQIDLEFTDDDEWEIAEKRYELIKPILDGTFKGRAEITNYSEMVNVSTATLYRWVRTFKATETVSALLSKQRGWREGKSRLANEVDIIIKGAIDEYYLTKQRLSKQQIIKQVRIVCLQKGIKPPADNTIRKRLDELSEKIVLRNRGQREKAQNKFTPTAGKFPDVMYPLDVIQIDHTPMDIIIVDDENRKPIGRPWLTIAVDIYSRMVCGYYLSLDAPSEISVALCIAHSALPKEEWLNAKDIKGEWNVWGIPRKIHVDNGADFRSDTLKRACLEYGIELEFRPVRTPRYGGHVERLIGTFMKEVHQLGGTTFSNIKERDSYDSDKHAMMTFDELEKWLLNLTVNLYHKRIHSTIDMTPETKWKEGIFGYGDFIGRGLPEIPASPKTLMLDFMPYEERTVQTTGVTWDGIRYFDYILSTYIGMKEDGKAKRYIFRRDPRDISIIYFFNPDTLTYIPIPTANQEFPSMSLWQLKERKKRLKERGISDYNEFQIIEAMLEMQRQVDDSTAKTKRARRAKQRDKIHKKKVTPINPKLKETFQNTPDIENDLWGKEVKPFEDIE